eukprot:SAG22_NODE_337_length_12043_cov_58.339556_3_plen_69_part_00
MRSVRSSLVRTMVDKVKKMKKPTAMKKACGTRISSESVIWLESRYNVVNEVSAESGAMSVIWLLWRAK